MSEETVSAADVSKIRFKPNLISKSKVRKYLLDHAKSTRAHPFNRVSDDVYFGAEEALKRWLRSKVSDQPSCGKTIT